MPWLEERTLTLFVRDTEVRRYEPGVRERGVDVDRPSGPLMGSADTDTDTDPDRALSLKAPVIHGHLIRQHVFSVQLRSLIFTYLTIRPMVPRDRHCSPPPCCRSRCTNCHSVPSAGRSSFTVVAVRAPTSTSTVAAPIESRGSRTVKGGRERRGGAGALPSSTRTARVPPLFGFVTERAARRDCTVHDERDVAGREHRERERGGRRSREST